MQIFAGEAEHFLLGMVHFPTLYSSPIRGIGAQFAGAKNAEQGVSEGVEAAQEGVGAAKQKAELGLDSGKAEVDAASKEAKSQVQAGKSEVLQFQCRPAVKIVSLYTQS